MARRTSDRVTLEALIETDATAALRALEARGQARSVGDFRSFWPGVTIGLILNGPWVGFERTPSQSGGGTVLG